MIVTGTEDQFVEHAKVLIITSSDSTQASQHFHVWKILSYLCKYSGPTTNYLCAFTCNTNAEFNKILGELSFLILRQYLMQDSCSDILELDFRNYLNHYDSMCPKTSPLGSILWLFHLPFIKLTIIGQVKQITK
jgi:hypothetical protein